MKDAEVTYEVDRIKKLIGNFGWKVAKQKVIKEEIELTIEKQIPDPEKTPDKTCLEPCAHSVGS